jgi:enoyl-CoA hydratase/3-hydroxyacyl-CoA dehydrogenase
MDARTASDLGLVSHLVESSEVDSTITTIAKAGKPVNKYPGKPAVDNSRVGDFAETFYSDANLETLLSGNCPGGFDPEDRNISRQLKSLSRTAPIALRMASSLIDFSANTTLEQGLEKELDGLDTIFATADALEGLSALIEGRKPTYSNS